MKLKFLNKTIENRRFDYQPMYYDERKEKLEAKKEQYRRMENGEISEEERRAMFRENMRGEWSRTDYRQRQTSAFNIRILILVAVLFALGYFVFNGVDQVDVIVNKLW